MTLLNIQNRICSPRSRLMCCILWWTLTLTNSLNTEIYALVLCCLYHITMNRGCSIFCRNRAGFWVPQTDLVKFHTFSCLSFSLIAQQLQIRLKSAECYIVMFADILFSGIHKNPDKSFCYFWLDDACRQFVFSYAVYCDFRSC